MYLMCTISVLLDVMYFFLNILCFKLQKNVLPFSSTPPLHAKYKVIDMWVGVFVCVYVYSRMYESVTHSIVL